VPGRGVGQDGVVHDVRAADAEVALRGLQGTPQAHQPAGQGVRVRPGAVLRRRHAAVMKFQSSKIFCQVFLFLNV